MRAIVATLCLAVLLLSFSASVSGAQVNFTKEYSDPASDVMKLYTSNMTPVIVNNDFVMSPTPGTINIIWLRSSESADGNNISVELEVKGGSSITDAPNVTYTVNLYTDASNRTHYSVEYRNGLMEIFTNATNSPKTNITGNSTVGPPNVLTLTISKSLLGNITMFDIDATALMFGDPYSYEDFGWLLPGHPGTSPTQIKGRVTEAGSDKPLQGVNVSTDLGGYYVFTDSDGNFTLSLSPGTYDLTAAKEGYQSETVKVSLSVGETLNQDFVLSKSEIFGMGPLLFIGLIIAGLLAVLLAILLLWRRKRNKEKKP